MNAAAAGKKKKNGRRLERRINAYRGPRADLPGKKKLAAASAWWDGLPAELRAELQIDVDTITSLRNLGESSAADFFLALYSFFLYLEEPEPEPEPGPAVNRVN